MVICGRRARSIGALATMFGFLLSGPGCDNIRTPDDRLCETLASESFGDAYGTVNVQNQPRLTGSGAYVVQIGAAARNGDRYARCLRLRHGDQFVDVEVGAVSYSGEGIALLVDGRVARFTVGMRDINQIVSQVDDFVLPVTLDGIVNVGDFRTAQALTREGPMAMSESSDGEEFAVAGLASDATGDSQEPFLSIQRFDADGNAIDRFVVSELPYRSRAVTAPYTAAKIHLSYSSDRRWLAISYDYDTFVVDPRCAAALIDLSTGVRRCVSEVSSAFFVGPDEFVALAQTDRKSGSGPQPGLRRFRATASGAQLVSSLDCIQIRDLVGSDPARGLYALWAGQRGFQFPKPRGDYIYIVGVGNWEPVADFIPGQLFIVDPQVAAALANSDTIQEFECDSFLY